MSAADHWAKVAQSAEKLQRREAAIPVPALAWMFPEGEEAVWVVRNLGSSEHWQAAQSGERDKKLVELVRAMAAGDQQAEALRATLGIGSDDVPDEVRKRIAQIEMATVKPDIPADFRHDLVVRISENHPEEFFKISNKVMELTMGGSVMGKPKGSTKTRASG